MESKDIERALFQMGRLKTEDAEKRFPLLSRELRRVSPGSSMFPNGPQTATSLFEFLRNLREEFMVTELVAEMHQLIELEPAREKAPS